MYDRSYIKGFIGSMQQKGLVDLLVTPKSQDKDSARREFILNIIFLGSIFLVVLAIIHAFVNELNSTLNERLIYKGMPIRVLGFFLLAHLIGYLMSRLGNSRSVAFVLIFMYLTGAIYTGYVWGANVPMALLIYSLVIVMAGILISANFAFVISAISILSISSLIYFQDSGVIRVVFSWRNKPPSLGDGAVYGGVLFTIAIVSWLFNRESEKALARARRSETTLKRQRSNLETIVEKRTEQLRLAQLEKITQVYRFAEMGKIASGLFHDLVTPLNLVSLNLSKLKKGQRLIHEGELADTRTSLRRAIIGTKTIKNFTDSARRQIQNQEIVKHFSPVSELKQSIQILEHKANESRVKIIFDPQFDIKIRGNPIKFHQLITNLLLNAIEAYDNTGKKRRIVEVKLEKTAAHIKLSVHDWGKGISAKYIDRIFEPLFTTKGARKGIGIGLSLAKKIVEGFGGKIEVVSRKGYGTNFTVTIPIERSSKRKF